MHHSLEDLLIKCADALQGWDFGLSRLGAKEVLAWWIDEDQPAFVFRGDALRMERSLFMQENQGAIENRGHCLDLSLQKAFGFKPEVEYRRGRIAYIQPQLLSVPDAQVFEVLDGVERMIADVFEEELGIEVSPHVTLMPSEGSPWNYDDDETPFYNAKKRKMFSTPRPPWLISVMVRDETTGNYDKEALGADFCQLVDVVGEGHNWAVSGQLEGYPHEVLVTHSLGFDTRDVDAAEMARFVNDCGGFLFPSLAVGSLPAVDFGPVCLIFDPMIVLSGMKPYKKSRGRWPIVIHNTDAWTATMRDFLGQGALELYNQLTGHAGNFSYYSEMHFWGLGPPIPTGLTSGFRPTGSKLVLGTKQLRTQLKRRAKAWRRDMTSDEIEAQHDSESENRYPYLEAKANSVISPDAATGCVYPRLIEDEVRAYLDAIGFGGLLFPLDTPQAAFRDSEMALTWSWAVHDAIAAINPEYKMQISLG